MWANSIEMKFDFGPDVNCEMKMILKCLDYNKNKNKKKTKWKEKKMKKANPNTKSCTHDLAWG